jgi:periplasmic protein TonB
MRDDAFFSECLVDGEAESKSRRSWMRRRAVGVAVLTEGAIIAGLAIWPLFTPATPPPEVVMFAHIPYRGDVILRRTTRASAPSRGSRPAITPLDFSHPQMVTRIVRAPAFSIQDVPVPVIGDAGSQMSVGGPGVPGGFGSEAIVPPSPAPKSVRIIRRSEGVQESQLISRITPTYPQIARVARISGIVELTVLVGRDGRVLSVQVLSGNPLLATAAKQAVEQWRYRPAILDGQAVEVEARVTVNFVLDE